MLISLQSFRKRLSLHTEGVGKEEKHFYQTLPFFCFQLFLKNSVPWEN